MKEPQAIVDEARRLWNEGKYWHVHEELEQIWLVRKGPEKELLQGLILVAASLVHAGNKKWEVVWPMMDRALKKLEGQPDVYYSWEVAKFRDHFARVLKAKKLEIPTV
jgi:predicted metal-dependent hydrolase